MPPAPDLESLRRLRGEIEAFLQSIERPVVVEDGAELFDLNSAQWRLSLEFGKLILQVWNPARSITRRVEEVAYRDCERLGLFVRKPGARETGTLEFRAFERAEPAKRKSGRTRFRQELLAALRREFPGWNFERVSNRSDREHSFSIWYTRGSARQGRTTWAFLGLDEAESPAAFDAVLAFGLIWLDWLRGQSERTTVAGLKLFLPRAAVDLTAHRAAYLNRRTLQVELFECDGGKFRPVDLKDFGNVETSLVQRRQGQALAERHQETLRQWLDDLLDHVDVVADPSATFLSLRVAGLEIGRLEGQLAPQIFWGLEGSYQRLEENNRAESRSFVKSVLELRAPHSKSRSHAYYRLQSERWLESLLVRDLTKIDPALSPACVYPQVPAFSGTDRGVIDILSVTRAGRLAVIELKLQEEINLPMQGLDYWLRVKWLQERRQFEPAGYFPEFELADAAPLLYFVCPAFRFHSTTGQLIRYLDPSIQVIQVGLNDRWREGIKVLFRREARPSF